MFKYNREINQATLQAEMKPILDAIGNHGESVLIKSTLRGDIAVVSREVLDGIVMDKKSLELERDINSKIEGDSMSNNINCYGDNKPFIEQGSIDKLKGSDMKEDNKHPHHDLIAEWLGDMNKEFQVKSGSETMCDVDVSKVISDKKGGYEFRLKPREFIKGYWYPCIKSGSIQVLMWTGFDFSTTSTFDLSHSYKDTYFDEIGGSLGEVKFK